MDNDITVFDADIAVLELNIPKLLSDVIVGPVTFPVELIVPVTSNEYAGLELKIPTPGLVIDNTCLFPTSVINCEVCHK